MCREECPTYAASRAESFFAGGRLRVLRTFVEKDLPLEEDFLHAMYFCTTCKLCEEICPISMEYVELMETLRRVIVEQVHHPYGPLLKFAENTLNQKNPYGDPLAARKDWVTPDIHEVDHGPYAYFAGCTGSYRNWEVAQKTARILSKVIPEGIVILGPDEYCCGSPLIRTGQDDFMIGPGSHGERFRVVDMINHNVEALKERGVQEVIFSCAGCYKTATEDWPRFYGGDLPFHSAHLTQFLAEKVETQQLQFTEWNATITYHDPCHLGRHMGVFDAPRTILNAIPGVTLVEMHKTRHLAHCCGAGGGVKACLPTQALDMGKLRVQEALETGAEVLVTSCVFCKNNFAEAIEELHAPLRVQNIEDVVADLLL
jgi:heterodisulfide reductase subunit D